MGFFSGLQIGSAGSSALIRFVAAGLLAAGIITGGAFWVVRNNAIAEATRNAQEIAAIDGRGIVEPALSEAVLAGDPTALQSLDRLVHERVLSRRVVRVKLWTPQGRIVYSDASPLVGRSFGLDGGELQAIRTGNVIAEVSELNKPENVFERPFGRLLEVYLPIRSASNQTLLFETYQVYSSIDDDQQRIWGAFFPVLLGGIILLFIVQIPLALGLARNLEKSLLTQEDLLKRALDASEAERRRIARDLHDGVVQTLAGTAFKLSATARRATTAPREELEEALTDAAQASRAAAGDLRTLIVQIAPPDLQGSRLEGALADLLAPLEAEGMETSLAAGELDHLGRDEASLLYRAAQEALRNVAAHAAATRVEVRVSSHPGGAELEVKDNGRGFTADEVLQRQRDGHVGLAMLRGLVEDGGGELGISSTPGEGTTVRIRISSP